EIHEGSAISIGRTLSQGLTYHGLLRAEQLLSGSDMEKNHIRLSRATYKRVAVIGRLLKEYEERANMKRDEVFEIFTEAGNAAMDFAILRQRRSLLREAERFLSMRPVLSAQTVMDITGCRPGRELGALLKEMKKMQFLGRIRDEDEALRWLSQG
ncbi:MAG TPA: hypothetical protein VN328_06960, partial [Thermodesulfovibrionales bacterium]|nr:hypothetical protein [Thermodesulfovibrionales bacterium]